MTGQVLLVDYENIGRLDLSSIPAGVRVPFFFGASQKTVPTEFLKAALKLGERFVPIDIEGHGKNALDFHIAYYLGETLAQQPATRCVILSKDKGFDPLVRHLVGRGFAVRRVATLAETFAMAQASPKAAAVKAPAVSRTPARTAARSRATPTVTPLARALKRLGGMAAEKRPHKRRRLVADLHSHFAKQLSEAEVNAVVDEMLAAGQLSEKNGVLSYGF